MIAFDQALNLGLGPAKTTLFAIAAHALPPQLPLIATPRCDPNRKGIDMTFTTLKLTTLTVLGLGLPAAAMALAVGDSVGTSEADIRAAFEAQGAQVLEIEIEDGEIEVEYLVDGVEYEAEIDPATGMIAELETEDEDDDDEDGDDS